MQVLISLACAGVILAACSSPNDEGPADDPAPQATPPLLTVTTAWNAWPQAEVSGVLRIRHGCLFLSDLPAVFPKRSKWAGDVLELPSGVSVRLGDQLAHGGGYYQLKDVREWDQIPGDELSECVSPKGKGEFVITGP